MTAIYHWEARGSTLPKFERRTTICSAPDEVTAESALKTEAEAYQTEHITLLDAYLVQELDELPCENPVEVAHEMTIGIDPDSGEVIDPEEFVRKHWSVSRIPSCDLLGIAHSWYNHDGTRSACYNCESVSEGRLGEPSPEGDLAENVGGRQPTTRPESEAE